MTIFLRYGDTTSQTQTMAIFSINNRDSVTKIQTLAKAGSPKIYINTVTGSHTDVYVDAGESYPIVEVSSFVPYAPTQCVLLEDATNVDFSQLQEVSL